jgi:hypothetical protein
MMLSTPVPRRQLMSAASVEQPFDQEESVTLTTIADEVMERHPGYRVEIIKGHLLVPRPRTLPTPAP